MMNSGFEDGGRIIVEHGFVMVLMDGCHRGSAVQMLKFNRNLSWTDKPHDANQIIRRNVADNC